MRLLKLVYVPIRERYRAGVHYGTGLNQGSTRAASGSLIMEGQSPYLLAFLLLTWEHRHEMGPCSCSMLPLALAGVLERYFTLPQHRRRTSN